MVLDHAEKLINEESLDFNLLEECSLDNSVAMMDNIAAEFLQEDATLHDDFMRLRKYLQETGQMQGLLQELVLKVQKHIIAEKINAGV